MENGRGVRVFNQCRAKHGQMIKMIMVRVVPPLPTLLGILAFFATTSNAADAVEES